jgi:hypothetical protein
MRDFLGGDLSVVVEVPAAWSPVQGAVVAGDLYDGTYRVLLVGLFGPDAATMMGAVGWLQFGWFDVGDDRFIGSAAAGQPVVCGVEYLWAPGIDVGSLQFSPSAVAGVYQKLAVAFWPRSRIPPGVTLSCELYF